MSSARSKGPLIYVGGGKGGVGKSLLSMAIVDYLETRSRPLLFVETEPGNAEIPKAYPDIEVVPLDLTTHEGWLELIDTSAAADPATYIVINSAGGAMEGVREYGQLLERALPELRRDMIVLWPINHQRASLEYMAQFQKALPTVAVNIIINEHYGRPEKFGLYNDWRESPGVDEPNPGLRFDNLADRVASQLVIDHMTIADAAAHMSIGNRMEMQRWRGEVAEMLAKVIP